MADLLLVQVVGEMGRVPEHHVRVGNALPVDEAVYGGRGVRL